MAQYNVSATAGLSKTEFDSNMGAGQIINPAGDFKINFSGVSDDMRRKSAEVGVTGQIDTGLIAHQFAINSTYYQEDYHLRGFRNLLNQDWITSIYNPVWGPEPALPKWQAKLGAEWDVAALQGLTLTTNATSASKQYLSVGLMLLS